MYQRKSVDPNSKTKSNSYYEQSALESKYQYRDNISPMNRQIRTRNPSYEKTYDYDIGEGVRPRTPSANDLDIKKRIQQQSLRRTGEKPIIPKSKYGQFTGNNFGQYPSGKSQNKRIYLNDFNQQQYGSTKAYQYPRITTTTKNNNRYMESQHLEEKQNDPYFGQHNQSSLIDQKQGYQRYKPTPYSKKDSNNASIGATYSINRTPKQTFSKGKIQRSVLEQKSNEQQLEVMKKISRINQLNQEINSRLQKMLAKVSQ